jgi:hypothetical protein
VKFRTFQETTRMVSGDGVSREVSCGWAARRKAKEAPVRVPLLRK